MATAVNTCSRLSTGSSGDLTKIAPATELKKFLNCPVCFKIPWGPIHQCRRGHIICSRCRSKVSNCSVCPAMLTETRNYFMENLVDKSIFKCEYSVEGCDVSLPGAQLQKHIAVCGYRPLKCHVGRKDGCGHSLIELSQYTKHLEEVHGFTHVQVDDTGKFALTHSFLLPYKPASTKSWKSYYVSYDNKTFIPRSSTVGTIDMLKFHVSLLDPLPKTETAKYTVHMTFENMDKSQPRPSYTFKIPVMSIRATDKEAAEGHQAILNFGALKEVGQIDKNKSSGNEEQFEWTVQYHLSQSCGVF